MKRNLVWMVLVFLVLGCSLAFSQEQKEFKPIFNFSVYGGKERGEFALNYEALYNQRWDKWGIQVATMANINKSIHEYGFSAGGWRQFETKFGTGELGVFLDGLYLDKIPEYGYGGFHGQIRPEFRMVEKDYSIDFFYAHPITKKYLLTCADSAPYFWQDAQAYYLDTVHSRTYVVPMRYFGVGSEINLTNFLKVKAEGLYAPFEKEEFYRLRVGAEVKPFKWITFSIDWTKMKASHALGLDFGGDYQAIRIGATIPLGRAQEYHFSDLTKYDVITPRYPAVKVEKEYSLTTTRIANLLKCELTVDPQSVCLGKPINGKVEYSGGTEPRTVYIEFMDGTGSNQASFQHTYAKVGTYCIKATVSDSSGHSATDCKCITVSDCKKKFKLTVWWDKGVGGTPEPGVYSYEEGTVVKYSNFLLPGFINLNVRIDGERSPDDGEIAMNKDREERVYTDKECLAAKILTFTATKKNIYSLTELNPLCGIEVVLKWTTEHAQKVFLNGESVALNGTKTVTITKTTVFTLTASNDCPSSDTRSITVVY